MTVAIRRRITIARLVAGLAACLLLAVPAAAQINIPQVATVAALQALGSAGAQTPTVYVQNYARLNDGGGGTFTWIAGNTAPVNTGTLFAATGVASGRWLRVNYAQLTVNMFGTGNADDSAAFNNAFAYCNSSGQALFAPSRTYRFQHNILMMPGCSFTAAGSSGNAGSNTMLDFTNDADGGACFSVIGYTGGKPTTYGLLTQGNELAGFAIIGNAQGVGKKAHCTMGLYISRVVSENVHDIEVQYINGPGIFYGNSVLSTMDRVSVLGSGSSTTAEVEIDGEKVSGVEYEGTTLIVTNMNIGSDDGNGAQGCLKIDRYTGVDIRGGSVESCGILLMVESKPSTTYSASNIVLSGVDLEAPSNSAVNSATFCTGWSGAPGTGCQNDSLYDNLIIADSQPLTSVVIVTNSINFLASHNLMQTAGPNAVLFDFQGTANSHENVYLSNVRQVPGPYTYVRVNGAAIADALPQFLWTVDNEPVTVAHLPVCSAAYVNHPLVVTDANSATFNAVVAGGGTNTLSVGCDGTNWRIGNQ